jgi:hypothetical protein
MMMLSASRHLLRSTSLTVTRPLSTTTKASLPDYNTSVEVDKISLTKPVKKGKDQRRLLEKRREEWRRKDLDGMVSGTQGRK